MCPIKGLLNALGGRAIRIFEELGIRYFDLLEPPEQAPRDEVDVQEQPADRWHPSPACAEHLARHRPTTGPLK